MPQLMITFNHVEGVWEQLSPEDREAHGKWLERFMAELRDEMNTRSSRRQTEMPAAPQCEEVYRAALSRNQG